MFRILFGLFSAGLLQSSADSNELRMIYFADFLRSDCFPELKGQLLAGFSATLLADFLHRELRPASYCNFVILFVQTSEKINQ
jgi:hypothetical protein